MEKVVIKYGNGFVQKKNYVSKSEMGLYLSVLDSENIQCKTKRYDLIKSKFGDYILEGSAIHESSLKGIYMSPYLKTCTTIRIINY